MTSTFFRYCAQWLKSSYSPHKNYTYKLLIFSAAIAAGTGTAAFLLGASIVNALVISSLSYNVCTLGIKFEGFKMGAKNVTFMKEVPYLFRGVYKKMVEDYRKSQLS